MTSQNKKFFPKLKKKLKWFLTDESWKISKKDALGLAVGAVLLSWVGEVFWDAHSNSCIIENLANPVRPNTWDWFANPPATGVSRDNTPCLIKWSIHWSWVVNWHFSSNTTLWVSSWLTWQPNSTWHSSHSSHGSHGSHGSHWSHWSHGQW